MSIVNLQAEPIYVRSPYVIDVNVASSLASAVEIYIWNNGDTPPTTPTYTLQKDIPTATNFEMTYNISSYVREYIDWTFNDLAYSSPNTIPPNSQWCYVKVIRKYKNSFGVYIDIDTKTYYAFDGYGYYEQGYNPELGIYGLIDGATYEYFNDPGYTGQYLERYGDIRYIPTAGYTLRYTNLVSGLIQNVLITGGMVEPVLTTYAVPTAMSDDGVKFEYVDLSSTVLFTAYFKPIQECKYTPVVVDFVNKFGAWQRVFFFKASRTKLTTTRNEYSLFKRELVNYDVDVPQRQQFNVEGKKSISLNTGWVDQTFNENVLEQMMLSEEIRINRLPAKMMTQSTELFEHINKKMINYKLDFEYAYDTINTII